MKTKMLLLFFAILSVGTIKSQNFENKSILIIDSNIPNLKMLLKSLEPGTQIVYLDGFVNPLTSIDKIIKENAPLSSLHILTHGKPGALVFSNQEINIADIENQEQLLASWKKYFPDGGDILLYGCEVAKGVKGVNFINTLSSITGVDVAASDNMTGSSLNGADWKLELNIGEIEARIILNESKLQRYPAILR